MRKYPFVVLIFAITFGAFLIGRVQSGERSVINARTPAELYSKNCASCHGKDGRAKTFKAKFNHARDLTDTGWHNDISDERIFNTIMNGKGKKMPAFAKKFSEQEIESLVSYVRALKK
jgi:cbb3-type cytochrome c oxidase subunit III